LAHGACFERSQLLFQLRVKGVLVVFAGGLGIGNDADVGRIKVVWVARGGAVLRARHVSRGLTARASQERLLESAPAAPAGLVGQANPNCVRSKLDIAHFDPLDLLAAPDEKELRAPLLSDANIEHDADVLASVVDDGAAEERFGLQHRPRLSAMGS
jgi:hypothetical protein